MITSRWELVKSIFGAALELPEEDRRAFVGQACGNDVELHAEVLTLLAAHQSMGSFMKDPSTQEFSILRGMEIRASLRPGEVLCERFEIVRLLGEGGMGRVYEALDLDLGVRLALKTIRPEISSDPRTIDLFKHEIQLARQITHPNVCRIFDLERHKGGSSEATFLTMELLEGETLEARILRDGAMRTDQALPLVQQMTDGLAAIHEMAVVHRDFKPSNVLLVPSGAKVRVVITDFGLARAKALAVVTESPTGARALTGLAGTPAYMAPEQVTGGVISPATDIYALGLVLYKMVTGRLPYTAGTDLVVLRSRMSEPRSSPQLYSPDLDPDWERGIMRCLELDPASRFQSAAELIEDLGGRSYNSHELLRLSSGAIGTLPRDPANVRKQRIRATAWIVAAIIFLALSITTVDFIVRRQRPTEGTVELAVVTSDPGLSWGPSLSANGKLVAFSSDRDEPGNPNKLGNLSIWLHNFDDRSTLRVTRDSSDATTPALSPDGKQVAYRSERDGGGIYISTVKGQNERLLVPLGRNPKFSPDGNSIAYWVGEEHNQDDSFKAGGKVFVVPASGGVPRQIEPQFADARFPSWSPDGHFIMFQGAPVRKATFEEASDWWIESETNHRAIPTGAFPIIHREALILYSCPFSWSPKGVIFAARKSFGTSLWVLQLSGDSRATLPVRRITSGTDDHIEPWASDRKLALSSTNASVDIWKIPASSSGAADSEGPKQVTESSAVDSLLSVSNDGQKLVFHRRTGEVEQTLLRDTASGIETALPIPGDATPVISPDGKKIAYSITRALKHPIFAYDTALNTSEQFCDDCGAVMALSPDESRVLYSLQDGSIGMLDLTRHQKSEPIKNNGTILEQSSFSPDGRWIAFISTVDEEHSQIFIAPLEKDGFSPPDRWIPVTAGNTRDLRPNWSSDGRSLFFLSNRDGFYCVWQIQLDRIIRRPLGSPRGVWHLHRARLSLMHLSIDAMGLSLGGKELFLNPAKITGNIFAADF